MRGDDITFERALKRLQEIVDLVKKKEISLEKSLDLLEEGIQLANFCTERIDHTRWQEEKKGFDERGAEGEDNLS